MHTAEHAAHSPHIGQIGMFRMKGPLLERLGWALRSDQESRSATVWSGLAFRRRARHDAEP